MFYFARPFAVAVRTSSFIQKQVEIVLKLSNLQFVFLKLLCFIISIVRHLF